MLGAVPSSFDMLRRDLRRQFLLSLVQVEGQGSLRAVGGVSVRRHDHQGGPCYFGSVAQMCTSAWQLWCRLGTSPYLATDYTLYELCLPSARCMGMCMNLVDPVSSGKYCGTCVSTAPAADPAVMSFTVLFLGSTIVATAAVGITCFASADCTVSRLQCAAWVFTSGCRGDGSFTPDGAYDSLWDSVEPMTGEYTINFFQYQEDVGCVHAV